MFISNEQKPFSSLFDASSNVPFQCAKNIGFPPPSSEKFCEANSQFGKKVCHQDDCCATSSCGENNVGQNNFHTRSPKLQMTSQHIMTHFLCASLSSMQKDAHKTLGQMQKPFVSKMQVSFFTIVFHLITSHATQAQTPACQAKQLTLTNCFDGCVPIVT